MIAARLAAMLRMRGAALPEPEDRAALADAVRAAQRCAACGCTALCDEWLRAGDPKAYRGFCPNAHFVEHLRQCALVFR